jgi:hypothetical protein
MTTITPQVRRATPEPAPALKPAAAPAELHIESVVLHGFSHAAGHRAADALRQELTRLIAAEGLPQFTSAPRNPLDAGAIRASATRPELTGTRVARAIHGRLGA